MERKMSTLDEIAIRYGTDKATVFTRTYAKPHGYTLHLEPFFAPLRDQPIKFLEIGAAGGESIKTWLEYFPNAKVFGVDNNQGTNPWNTVDSGADPRYTFVYGDQTDKTMWACFAVNYGADWDVVLDDGSHTSQGIITAFNCLWPLVKSDGLYVIEDLGVCYGAGSVFLSPGFPCHMDWLRGLLDEMNNGRGDIESVHFSRELAIIKKR
jgi:hypothetical protein